MKKTWEKQEARLESEGAKRQPQSGAGFRKGDNLGQTFCIQAKTTSKKQFPLKLSELMAAQADAGAEDRIPAMQVEFSGSSRRFAVLRWEDFVAILGDAGLSL